MPTTVGEQPKIYKDTGGDRQVVESGGEIRMESGSKITAAGTQANLTTVALTDSTGGTVTQTLAAGITDAVAKNAIASLAASVNAIIVAIRGMGGTV